MEGDTSLSENLVREEDDHLLQFLDSMDSYLLLLQSLSCKLRQLLNLQGWLEIASARHSMGSLRISSILFDLKPHSAATTLQVNQPIDESVSGAFATDIMLALPRFSLYKWESSNDFKCESEEDMSEETHAKSYAPQLRWRGPYASPEAQREVPTSLLPLAVDQLSEVKKQRSKSLAVFGALVSPKLREAQASFETVLETLVQIANVRSTMLAAFAQVQKETGNSN